MLGRDGLTSWLPGARVARRTWQSKRFIFANRHADPDQLAEQQVCLSAVLAVSFSAVFLTQLCYLVDKWLSRLASVFIDPDRSRRCSCRLCSGLSEQRDTRGHPVQRVQADQQG